ncbi:hypothetical protein NC652_018299 [Populus alba x Populus x berolinensis]|nr:hypothetical protein NC652_018299 [Populus alba x Populus x berolinensis]
MPYDYTQKGVLGVDKGPLSLEIMETRHWLLGDYEYIDITLEDENGGAMRLIVDLDFRTCKVASATNIGYSNRENREAKNGYSSMWSPPMVKPRRRGWGGGSGLSSQPL